MDVGKQGSGKEREGRAKEREGTSSPEPARKDVLNRETERQEVRHGARARS